MADSKGYYAMLGVSEKASYQEIKKSYRRLARRYHPDRNRTPYAEDMIKKINAAFEILSDENKRHEYDRMSYDNHEAADNSPDDSGFSSPSASPYEAPADSGSPGHHKRQTSQAAHLEKSEENLAGTYHIDTPKGRFHIIVEPTTCLAFGSCEILAPKVFVVEKNKRINPKAKVENETGADFQTILAAAQTCPTKAIRIIDRYTGEQIFP